MTKVNKTQLTTNDGEDMGKEEHLHTATEMMMMQPLWNPVR